MRVLVVSDIHANLAAFEAVLQETRADRDAVVSLGDLVGYGPDPRECIALAAEQCSVLLGGNHDYAAGGVVDLASFADHACIALEWTRLQLTPGEAAYLAALPLRAEFQGLLLSHGSPEDPLWGYIFSKIDAAVSFARKDFACCFFGHTHLPSYFIQTGESPGEPLEAGYGKADQVIKVNQGGARFLLNPGSVGFPRDQAEAHRPLRYHSAIARYALFDTETGLWRFKRLEYDMQETAQRMRRLGLW